jgi:hypothetical protein
VRRYFNLFVLIKQTNIPITDRIEITNPNIGVFRGVKYKGRPPTPLHFNKNATESKRNGLHFTSFSNRIGALKSLPQGCLEFKMSNNASILRMKATVASEFLKY